MKCLSHDFLLSACFVHKKENLHIISSHRFAPPLSPTAWHKVRRNPTLPLKRNIFQQNMRNPSCSSCLKSAGGRRTLAAPLAAKLRACCAPTRASRNQHAALLLCFWRNTKSEKSVLAPPVRLVPRQAAGSVSALRKPNPYFDPSKFPTQFHAVARWIHESFEFSDRLFGCG